MCYVTIEFLSQQEIVMMYVEKRMSVLFTYVKTRRV